MENERDVEFTPTPGGLNQASDLGGTTGSETGSFDATRGLGAAGTGGATGTGSATGTVGASGADQGSGSGKDRARDIKERAAEEVESRVSEQKHRAADSLADVAQSLRTAGQQLPDDNGVGEYVLKAANQVDNLANMLNNREVADLVDGVEDFARRQPAAFIGSAFAIGMIGARFLKSTQSGYRAMGSEGEWTTSQTPERFGSLPRDSVSRPDAPGYVPPSTRDISGDGAGGYS